MMTPAERQLLLDLAATVVKLSDMAFWGRYRSVKADAYELAHEARAVLERVQNLPSTDNP